MANTIVLKRSATEGKVPTTSQLALGEIAINTFDGLIYIKKDNGTPSIVQIGGVTSVNTLTGDVVIGTDEVTEGSSNLYFTNARARAAVSAGTGISYNSSTGVISTTQNLSTSGTPTFAGMTLTGDVDITGDIIPSADNTYSLGSADYMWRDVYVGPGSLYVNGQKVLEDNSGTITVSADVDQTLQLRTTGSGNVQVTTDASAVFQVNSTMQIGSGKNITDSAGVKVNFGDAIEMNSNKIIGLGAPSASTDAATKGYVDTEISNISTNSISEGNSSVTVTDSGTGTVTVSIDGSTALTVTSTGVVVAGNFTVQGTQTTVESNTVAVADNIITLNSDVTGTATQNAGVEVERGDDANVSLRWNEGSDIWTFTNDGATYHPMATDTDDLLEGSTNLYFTQARARTSLSSSTASGISYNSSTGNFSLGSIPNSSLSNNAVTFNGTTVSLGGSGSFDTDAVSEGASNVYFTNIRARGAISVSDAGGDGSLSYNSTTGVISYTGPSAAEVRAHFSAGTGIEISNGTISTSITQYTDALARGAISVSGGLSYNSTTGVISFTQDKAFSSLTGVPTTVAGYGITDAYTKTEVDSAISTAVAGKDNTDEITEGTTNLYFTTARAQAAISVGGDLTYAAGVVSFSLANHNTTDLAEGTNLYYTDARARGAVNASGDLSYDSVSGEFSYTTPTTIASLSNHSTTNLAEGTNLYWTTARGESMFDTKLAAADTDDLAEGASNLYFTTARARASFSAGTNISIVDGVISANDTSVDWSEIQNKPDPVVTVTLTGDVTGTANTTLTDLASGTVSVATTIAANSVALGTDTTGNYVATVSAGTGISVSGSGSEGAGVTVTNTGVTSVNGSTGAVTLTNFHSAIQTVTSTQATTNETATVDFTFSDLSTAKHYNVYLNRFLLRPTEFSVSGSTITIAIGTLATDDELEVSGLKQG